MTVPHRNSLYRTMIVIEQSIRLTRNHEFVRINLPQTDAEHLLSHLEGVSATAIDAAEAESAKNNPGWSAFLAAADEFVKSSEE